MLQLKPRSTFTNGRFWLLLKYKPLHQEDTKYNVKKIKKNFSHAERLQKLQLLALGYRRLRADVIETNKLMTGKCNVGEFPSFTGSLMAVE